MANGLFGPSPAEIQAQIQADQQAQAMAMASLPRGRMGVYRGAMAGIQAGQGLGQLFGLQDPRLQQAQAIQQIKMQADQSGFAPGTPEYFRVASQLFQDANMPDMSIEAMNQANEAARRKQQEKLNDIKLRRAEAGARQVPAENYGLDNDRYVVIEQPSGVVKIVDKKTKQSTTTYRQELSDGRVGLYSSDNEFLGVLTGPSGKPIKTGAMARAEATQGRFTDREEGVQARHVDKEKRLGRGQNASLLDQETTLYEKKTEKLREMENSATKALALIDKKDFTATDAKVLQRILANFEGTNVRALADLEAWKNYGNIAQRIEGWISGFISGTPTEEQREMARDTFEYMLTNVIEPGYAEINAETGERAKYKDVPSELITRKGKRNKKILGIEKPPPQGAIELLRSNPELKPEFIEKYGEHNLPDFAR